MGRPATVACKLLIGVHEMYGRMHLQAWNYKCNTLGLSLARLNISLTSKQVNSYTHIYTDSVGIYIAGKIFEGQYFHVSQQVRQFTVKAILVAMMSVA